MKKTRSPALKQHTFWWERQAINNQTSEICGVLMVQVAVRKKTAQGRGREDTGTEVAVCAERSGKASLLRCTTQRAKEMREWRAG